MILQTSIIPVLMMDSLHITFASDEKCKTKANIQPSRLCLSASSAITLETQSKQFLQRRWSNPSTKLCFHCLPMGQKMKIKEVSACAIWLQKRPHLMNFQSNSKWRLLFRKHFYDIFVSIERDKFGILRRNPDNAEKYASRAYKCNICGWAYSDKSKDKAKAQASDCPSSWIYEEWKPQKLESLKFLKA